MIVRSVQIKNFRSIRDETLDCDELTALVGPNGSGKSAFLRALELFYSSDPKIVPEDFYNEDVSTEIEIGITFANLSSEAVEQFQKYVEDETLTVVRVFSLVSGSSSGKYHGQTLQNPDFVPIRAGETATAKKSAYQVVQQNPKYSGLPTWRSQEQGLEALVDWESNSPEACHRLRDDGQFFGFKQVAQGYLERYTRFIFVPAVRDASEDAAEGKGSPITELMDLVVRSSLTKRAEFVSLQEEVQTRYQNVLGPATAAEVALLNDQLTQTLKTYVPDAAVDLTLLMGNKIELPMPKASVRLEEDGYATSVTRTGHGLQRAFIMALLQHLALARVPRQEPRTRDEDLPLETETPTDIDLADLVLAIEEPELYQHPNRQRFIANILLNLATGTIPGVAGATQVIYATHSPLFVGTDRFNQIRSAKKVSGEDGKPKVTKLIRTTLGNVATHLWNLNGQSGPAFTEESVRARLTAIMTPWMNEGFFSDVAVLVEGEDDRAAVLGTASARGFDFESMGIDVIPCMGKNNIDRPAIIFQELGISTYIIFDSDQNGRNANPAINRYLMRLLGQPEEDWPNQVGDMFASFKETLEATLKAELGANTYDTLLAQVANELGFIKHDQAKKNPFAVRQVLERARNSGNYSATLETIIDKIVALRKVGNRP